MANPYFQFKQFTIYQDRCGMKVTTDACLFGAWVAGDIQKHNHDDYILDIGSGTGLLSMMLAQKSNTTIDGIELQQNDYNQSLQNIQNSVYKNQIRILNADVIKFNFDRKYDVIISNPPFYENDLKSNQLSKNIAHHSENLKLDALIGIIDKNLKASGSFYLLLPEKRKSYVEKIINQTSLFINEIIDVHQTEKHPAFRIMIKGSFKKSLIKNNSITIKENNEYTTAFRELLQAYYLQF